MADRDLEAELSDLERAWMAAVRTRDMPFLEALLADEFTLTTARPGVEVRSRREWLEVTRSLMTDVFVRGGDHGWLAVVRHVSPLDGPPGRGLSGQPLA